MHKLNISIIMKISLVVCLLFLSTWITGKVHFFATDTPFEAEIRAFETQDRESPPPQNAIVFTGSSSIRLWENLATYFPGKPILNRGFGGSELSQVLLYADRIITPYHPK